MEKESYYFIEVVMNGEVYTHQISTRESFHAVEMFCDGVCFAAHLRGLKCRCSVSYIYDVRNFHKSDVKM